jgi:hypothetical protein
MQEMDLNVLEKLSLVLLTGLRKLFVLGDLIIFNLALVKLTILLKFMISKINAFKFKNTYRQKHLAEHFIVNVYMANF